MLSELCHELKNWFDRGQPKIIGNFAISDGKLLDGGWTKKLQDGQYFRIVGSVFNDGVYCFNQGLELKDEVFHGAVWFMAIPQEIIDLSIDIENWQKKYGSADSAAMSPFNSESFAGYSYSKGSVASGTSNPNSWQAVFSSRLNRWRKL